MSGSTFLGQVTSRRISIVKSSSVRQLIESDRLNAQRLSGVWVIDEAEIARFSVQIRMVGRQWSAVAAWAVLAEASGRVDDDLVGYQRSRAKARLKEYGLLYLAPRLAARARRVHYFAHPSALSHLENESQLVLAGASAARRIGADLSPGDEVEAYIRESNLHDVVARYALDSHADRKNVILRSVADICWPLAENERVASSTIVAVDLLDHHDERSQRAAVALIGAL
jgi:hypothetical protein